MKAKRFLIQSIDHGLVFNIVPSFAECRLIAEVCINLYHLTVALQLLAADELAVPLVDGSSIGLACLQILAIVVKISQNQLFPHLLDGMVLLQKVHVSLSVHERELVKNITEGVLVKVVLSVLKFRVAHRIILFVECFQSVIEVSIQFYAFVSVIDSVFMILFLDTFEIFAIF